MTPAETKGTTMNTPKLPKHLHAAYDWTDAASELSELRELTGESLAAYCRDSAKNCSDNGDGDVSESDLVDLHDWLAQDDEIATETIV